MRESHQFGSVRILTESTCRWVVGALDSAWRAVHSYLEFTDPARLQEFFEKWGKNPDWFDPEPSKGPIPSGPRYGSIFEQYLHQTHK